MPFMTTLRGEGKDAYENLLLSSNADISLIAESIDQIIEIAKADDKKYIVSFQKFNGVDFDIDWFGYVTPSSYQDVLYSAPYTVNISANDRIGDLKGFKFLLTLLKFRLSGPTNLELDLRQEKFVDSILITCH